MRSRTLLLGSSAVLLATASGALAQEAAAVQEPQRIDDVIVTAQKREERLLETPQSITALGEEELSRSDATQFRDFATLVPALSFTSAGVGQTQVSLRGVTAGLDIGPTVGIYVDEVPYGSSTAFSNASSLALDVGLFDIERIEVLRGPQGTLYGAGAMGGVIKYITREPGLAGPSRTLRSGVSATEGGGVSYNAAGALNTPLSDNAALRATAFYARDGGFIDNVALGREDVDQSTVYGGRLDLRIQPSDDLDIRLSAFAQEIGRDGSPAADYTLTGDPVDGERDQRRLKDEPFEQSFRLASATIDYDLPGARLSSITSYQTVDTAFRQDASAVYVPVLGGFGLNFSAVAVDQNRAVDKFAQEVRLASSGDAAFEWLVGAYYTDERSSNGQHVVGYDPSGAVSPIDLATVSIPSRYQEIAAFGNVTFRINDAFDVTGGLRYARNDQSFEQIASGLLIGPTPRSEATDDVVTWLFNARYRPNERSMLYGRFATGYRPGGPNYVINDPVTGLPLAEDTFASDTLKSYELGYKAETAARDLVFDAALYHIDWNDIQVTTAAGGVAVIANAGAAVVDGAEVSLTARPAAGVTLTGAFAWQDARLDEDAPLLGAAAGDRLPNVPEFTAALTADYELSGDGWRPVIGATVRYIDDRVASFDLNPGLPQYDLPAYATVDLRLGSAFGPVDAQLFVRNLFDEAGQISAATVLSVAGGPAQVTMIQPRTIGVSATTRF